MTTQPASKNLTGRRLTSADEFAHLMPLPDPPQRTDMEQREHITRYDQTLRPHYSHRSDVLISGDGYLCYDRQTPRSRWLVPDLVVAFGVTPSPIVHTNGYVISEVGKPPDFVLEVASRTTGRRDYTAKPDIYAAYEVGEYWRSDPSGGRYHAAPMAGDRLVNGAYEPIPLATDANGLIRGYSPALDLQLHWRDGWLRFWDPATEEYLLEPNLAHDALASTEAALAVAEAALQDEAAARQQAEARVRQLEDQLRRRPQE